MLCASAASTAVLFHGIEMPVCLIHDAKYARWGDEAETEAALQWGWDRPRPSGWTGVSTEPQLTPTGAELTAARRGAPDRGHRRADGEARRIHAAGTIDLRREMLSVL